MNTFLILFFILKLKNEFIIKNKKVFDEQLYFLHVDYSNSNHKFFFRHFQMQPRM